MAAVTTNIPGGLIALIFSACLTNPVSASDSSKESPGLASGLVSGKSGNMSAPPPTVLTLADRVVYQRAIEEVYWRHRIWPAERRDPKPPLNSVMSQAQLEKKVTEYLGDSEMLQRFRNGPITAEQLQAQMDRMASHTKDPD